RPEIDRRVARAAEILQLDRLLDRRPRAMSGGQRQRVAIGRAIVREPKVFLFDEPLSNLDAALRVEMRIQIANLHHDLNATMIYVTHDQVEAMTLADKIVVLQGGIVEQVGSPLELYHHPRNLFVAGFIGSPKMNFIEGTVSAADAGSVTLQLGAGASITVPCAAATVRPGDKVTFGVRPEHLIEDGEGEARITGQVLVVERLGGETYLYIKMSNEQLLVVKAGGESRARIGDTISVGVPAAYSYVFDSKGLALDRAERHPLADFGKDPFVRRAGAPKTPGGGAKPH
ncbi:MAG TPA: ATP-binding cassette domain-containing protein, partial [Alphaproteobacteria bacterium]|nr:ATP-binding cassette domain-containing protein [Alphaproteobacteria bacterium]